MSNRIRLSENFRCHRLFARTRHVTAKALLSVVVYNRCIVPFSRGLRLSAHKDLVFGTLVRRCQRHLMMKNQFGPWVK